MLSACTNTGAIKVGPDTYRVSTRVALTGSAGAQGEALETAAKYCQSQQREILVQHTESGECALRGGCGQATVTFYCLAPDDPTLRRPRYTPDPTTRIEIQGH